MAMAKSVRRQALYNQLRKQADPTAEVGLLKSRSILLLWFFHVVKGYDEADALEFICDGDDDGGIDGLLLETYETNEVDRHVVTAFQSKYPEQPSKVGVKEVSEFITRGGRLQHVDDIKAFVEPSKRSELQRLVQRFRLEEKINAVRLTSVCIS